MSADTDVLAVLNRRTCIGAVRQVAGQLGADPEVLLDSARFWGDVSALDPDDPGYMRRIKEAVQAAVSAPASAPPTKPPADQAAGGDRQWTLEDVERATPSEVAAAAEAGLLVDLGFSPRRKRR